MAREKLEAKRHSPRWRCSKTDDNWWQAKSQRTGKTGFIPSNYVTSLKSLVDVGWYHGKVRKASALPFVDVIFVTIITLVTFTCHSCQIARTTAEYLLKSGIDGSFLIRESQSQPGEHSITMKHSSKVRLGTPITTHPNPPLVDNFDNRDQCDR